jgi:hypothetical protein
MTLKPLSLRSKAIYVSSGVYSALKAIADVENKDCPDLVAEAILAEYLARDPRNARRQKLFAAAMEQIEKQLRDEFDETLPQL